MRRIARTDRPDVLIEYDELAGVRRVAQDLGDGNGGSPNGEIDLEGDDRVSERSFEIALDEQTQEYWAKSASHAYTDVGPALIGEAAARLTGFDGGVIGESYVINARGAKTMTVVTIEPAASARATTTTTYDVIDSTSAGSAESISENGLLRSVTNRAGVVYEYEYDGFERLLRSRDSRTQAWSTTEYEAATGRVLGVVNGHGDEQRYNYDATSGRVGAVESVIASGNVWTRYLYNLRGQRTHVFGGGAYPVRIDYDAVFGDAQKLYTYRSDSYDWNATQWPNPPDSAASITDFVRDEATGLLTARTYPADGGVRYSTTYDYLADGRLASRTWARGLVTSYSYDASSGDLAGVAYPPGAGMADLAFSYTRTGQLASVADAAGVRTFAHSDALELAGEALPAFFGGRTIAHAYDAGVVGRLASVEVTRAGGTTEYESAFEYATANSGSASVAGDRAGLLKRVTGPGLPGLGAAGGSGSAGSAGVFYSYAPNSTMLAAKELRSDGGSVVGRTSWSYEPERDLIASVENRWFGSAGEGGGGGGTGTVVSAFLYGNDSLGRREWVQRGGAAFSAGHWDDWSYNTRNGLTGSLRYMNATAPNWPDAPAATNPEHEFDRAYQYDAIGNRTAASENASPDLTAIDYSANSLNELHRVAYSPPAPAAAAVQHLAYDADGNLREAYIGGDLNCDGLVDNGDIDAFVLAILDPPQYALDYPGCDRLNGDVNGDGATDNGDFDGFADLLLGGNAETVWARFAWDAENRLTEWEPQGKRTAESRRVRMMYDYAGRRIRKLVEGWDGDANEGAGAWNTTNPVADTRFVWDGWRLLEELDGRDVTGPNGTGGPDGQPDNTVLRKYTWGNDLSGSLEGAGTIGGLIAVEDLDPDTPLAGTFLYHYDANGNVSELVDVTYVNGEPAATFGDIVAHYEYDAFGNTIVATSAYAESNPFRFSTKYYDSETGLCYYGYRYYSPKLGRWINRDPIGEAGGHNLYAFVSNDPGSSTDSFGLLDIRTRLVKCARGLVLHLDAYDCFGTYLGSDTCPLDANNRAWRGTIQAAIGICDDKYRPWYDTGLTVTGGVCYGAFIGTASICEGLTNLTVHPVQTCQAIGGATQRTYDGFVQDGDASAEACANTIATGCGYIIGLNAACNVLEGQTEFGERLDAAGYGENCATVGIAAVPVIGGIVKAVRYFGRAWRTVPVPKPPGCSLPIMNPEVSLVQVIRGCVGRAQATLMDFAQWRQFLSVNQLAAAARNPAFRRCMYGNALHQAVLREITQSPLIRQFCEPTGLLPGRTGPDIFGIGAYQGVVIEICSSNPATIARHIARVYGQMCEHVTYRVPVATPSVMP